jgi:hypothetical protein
MEKSSVELNYTTLSDAMQITGSEMFKSQVFLSPVKLLGVLEDHPAIGGKLMVGEKPLGFGNLVRVYTQRSAVLDLPEASS